MLPAGDQLVTSRQLIEIINKIAIVASIWPFTLFYQ